MKLHPRSPPEQTDAAAGGCAALGLEKRFANTHALLCLHVWLALVRLRAEGRDGKDIAQMVYEDFQEDVERRVHAEGVKVRVFLYIWLVQLGVEGCRLAVERLLARQQRRVWRVCGVSAHSQLGVGGHDEVRSAACMLHAICAFSFI